MYSQRTKIGEVMLKRKYKYVVAIQNIVIFMLLFKLFRLMEQRNSEKKRTTKYMQLYMLMVQWIETIQNGQRIAEWLKKNKYVTVAIYGMYVIGERLYIELIDHGIQVVCGIDKSSRDYLDGIKMYKPSDNLPEADVVIVTAISDYESIKKQLQEKINSPILSLQDILEEMLIE